MDNKHVLLSSFFPLALLLHYTVQQTETKLTSGCSLSALRQIHSYITGEFAIYNISGIINSNCSPEQQISALLENNKMMKGALVLCPVTSPNELWFGFVAAQEGKLNYYFPMGESGELMGLNSMFGALQVLHQIFLCIVFLK